MNPGEERQAFPAQDAAAWSELLGLHGGQDVRSQHRVLETLLLNGFQGLHLGDLQQPLPPPLAVAPLAQLPPRPPAAGLVGLHQELGSGSPGPLAVALQAGPSYATPSGSPTTAIPLHLPHTPQPADPAQLGHAPHPPQPPRQQQPRPRRGQQQQDLLPRKGNQHDLEKIRRTVYVCDIDQQVTEAELAGFFHDCGQIVDCRICGDPKNSMRFAFIEFQELASAQQALCKSGAVLGQYQLRVSPSKTAIVPVKSNFLPTSHHELEAVARTVYVANIDKTVDQDALRSFFYHLCGPISKLRLLGDLQHNSKIAFVEFESASSAKSALNCSGALLGDLPLRISPSKTPVRLEARRGHASRDGFSGPGSSYLAS